MTVELENVSKILSNTAVLDHISMNMQGGHVYGLHGMNGCGKTMLMRVVAGLIHLLIFPVCYFRPPIFL